MGNMDRRSFLKGSLLASGAAAAGMLAGCATGEQSETSTLSETGKQDAGADWLGEAPNLSIDDCAETVETDVVVVGSALAGIISAYSAIQNGAEVIMIERNGAPHISGSGIGFFDSNYQKQGGQPEHDAQVIMHKVINEGNLRVDPSLVALWAYNSGDILDELEENVLQPAGLPGTISLGEPLDERDLTSTKPNSMWTLTLRGKTASKRSFTCSMTGSKSTAAPSPSTRAPACSRRRRTVP